MSHETRDKSQEYAAARGQNPRVDSNGIAIKVTNVSKSFVLPHDKQNSIKGGLISMVKGGKRSYEKQEVLKDISFEIKKGEFFGIVGRNGSGKSTLLKMLAGIYLPTDGSIQVNGSLTPFIELGVGFNPDLTGRENVYLNGALLGFNRKQMDEMYDAIVDFAELERFMDQKLKNYSSGMQVRLAFSIAIRAKSDILLLDEVLAVGDAAFQTKCFEYFRELKRDKRTIILVSHDRGAIEQYCTRAALIDNGKLIAIDTPKNIFGMYSDITLSQIEDTQSSNSKLKKGKRWGSGQVSIMDMKVMINEAEKRVTKPGDEIKFIVTYKANEDVESPVYGITMNRTGETPIMAVNTLLNGVSTKPLKKNDVISVAFVTKNIFGNGKYALSPAVASSDANVIFDWRDEMAYVEVSGQKNAYAIINPDHSIILEP